MIARFLHTIFYLFIYFEELTTGQEFSLFFQQVMNGSFYIKHLKQLFKMHKIKPNQVMQ